MRSSKPRSQQCKNVPLCENSSLIGRPARSGVGSVPLELEAQFSVVSRGKLDGDPNSPAFMLALLCNVDDKSIPIKDTSTALRDIDIIHVMIHAQVPTVMMAHTNWKTLRLPVLNIIQNTWLPHQETSTGEHYTRQ